MCHDTAYTYGQDVHSSYNELRLLPPECPAQHVVQASLQTVPHGFQQAFLDYYGNRTVYVEVRQQHNRLDIRAEMVAETYGGALEVPGRRNDEFLQAGALTRPAPETATQLRTLAAGDATGLMREVRGLLAYQSGVTDTDTDVNAALQLRRGVCQDFAHVFITACRLKGLPARYVAGYLWQRGPGGPQESHAWAEVYAQGEWRAWDPTHGCPADERYLGVAVGRDYADIPPVRGVVFGAGTQGMRVRLRVVEQVTESHQ